MTRPQSQTPGQVLGQVLRDGARRLGNAREARLLLAEALGMDPGRLSIETDKPVSAHEIKSFGRMVEARLEGAPVSRILGRRAFWGRDFAVTPAVLDPRPETETLVAAALERPAPDSFADLGTGSGILATSLLAEWPQARAVATDISPEALQVAAANAARHGVADRLKLVRSDWFSRIRGRFPLIVSNPPYIAADEMADLMVEVRDHDPHLALTPGGDGLDAYRQITAGAPDHLTPGGWLMVEIGARQGGAVAALFARAGLIELRVLPDLDGRDRVVIGRKPPEK